MRRSMSAGGFVGLAMLLGFLSALPWRGHRARARVGASAPAAAARRGGVALRGAAVLVGVACVLFQAALPAAFADARPIEGRTRSRCGSTRWARCCRATTTRRDHERDEAVLGQVIDVAATKRDQHPLDIAPYWAGKWNPQASDATSRTSSAWPTGCCATTGSPCSPTGSGPSAPRPVSRQAASPATTSRVKRARCGSRSRPGWRALRRSTGCTTSQARRSGLRASTRALSRGGAHCTGTSCRGWRCSSRSRSRWRRRAVRGGRRGAASSAACRWSSWPPPPRSTSTTTPWCSGGIILLGFLLGRYAASTCAGGAGGGGRHVARVIRRVDKFAGASGAGLCSTTRVYTVLCEAGAARRVGRTSISRGHRR